MDRIHKRVQVSLHTSNTTSLEDVETGALEEYRELKRQVERGEWITPPPPHGQRYRRKEIMGKKDCRVAAARKEAAQAEKTRDSRYKGRRRRNLTCNHVLG